MTDVSVETTGSLSRRLKITTPAAEVEAMVAARLKKMTRTVRLDGFRPGKVPVSVVRERFGRRVFQEVVSEVMESGYNRAVAENDLTPAGRPDFNFSDIVPGRDIRFTVDVELYPEFTPAPLENVKIEKPVAEVRDADVEEMVERLRLRHAEWRPVDRAARDGDRVRVRFAEQVPIFHTDEHGDFLLEFGSAPGLSGDLAGQLSKAAPGDVRKIKIKVPKDYSLAEAAGKKFKFKVEVREIRESVLPALEPDFFKRCGVEEGGLKGLKDMLREGMEYELKNKLRAALKNNVSDALLRCNDFEAPKMMVEREANKLKDGIIARLGVKDAAAGKLKGGLFKEQALRRVKLGIIMNRIAELNQLNVSEAEFEAAVESAVGAYEDPAAAARHYRTDRQARSSLVGLILEEKVFQWVLGQVQVQEKTCTFKEAVDSEAA